MIACRVDDVPLGEGRSLHFDGRRVALFNTVSGWYAIDNACPHRGGPLADGIAADCSVTCPLHERRFDLGTGRPLGHDGPGVNTYDVWVSAGEVHIDNARTEIAA